MATSIRDQYLYVSSKNRHSGNPYDFDIIIDPGLVSCKEDEQLRISLVKLSMPLTITQINTSNNDVIFTDKSTNISTTITIPVGNYNVYDLASYVKSAYSGVTNMTFSKSTNHYIFTFVNPHQISFSDNCNLVFGFSSNNTSIGTTIESTVACQPNTINDIVLSVYGVSPISHNLDCLATKNMKMSHIIGMMSIQDIPFGVLQYDNINGEFSLSIGERDIKKLRFVMTNTDNQVLDFCNMVDYTMIVKISVRSKGDATLAHLKELKEYSRLQFLHSTMG
jgi:hypothetical protein